jgi:hypothetical protein
MPQALGAILVRCAVLGAGIAASYWVATWWGSEGDANIGLGLLVFGLLPLASLGWAFVDGSRRTFGAVAVMWAAVGCVTAVGWWLALAISEADESMSVAELLAADAGGVAFTFGLIAVPALLGAAVGQAGISRPG